MSSWTQQLVAPQLAQELESSGTVNLSEAEIPRAESVNFVPLSELISSVDLSVAKGKLSSVAFRLPVECAIDGKTLCEAWIMGGSGGKGGLSTLVPETIEFLRNQNQELIGRPVVVGG
mgnify:CR=1 FL=1|tara:strand:+ start:1726 stop:2079 length:354 start_codon:yes stop_codon:yes gene_type:complete